MLTILRRPSKLFRACAGSAALACALAAAGCTDLPQDGPLASDIVDQQSETTAGGGVPFELINLDATVAAQLSDNSVKSLRAAFGDTAADDEDKIEAGDLVVVTVWQVGSAGTTSGSSAGTTTMQAESVPEQIVDPKGTVAIPFAGRVAVAGMTVREAEAAVTRSLAGKVMQPQVLITVSRISSNNVAVAGDDIKGTLYMLVPNADRVLDAISAAGGIESPAYQARVEVVRGKMRASMPYEKLLADPAENIHLHPGDVLVVSKNPGFVTALGAVGKSQELQFQHDHMSLAEAMGNVGGLIDERADPSGVFIFRFEPTAAVAKMCAACDVKNAGALTPVVYRLDMSRAESFFVAQRFQMADHDVIFVANSPRVQLQKFLSLVSTLFSPALTTAVVVRDVQK